MTTTTPMPTSIMEGSGLLQPKVTELLAKSVNPAFKRLSVAFAEQGSKVGFVTFSRMHHRHNRS